MSERLRPKLNLTIMAGEFAILNLPAETVAIPTWAFVGHWYTFTRTNTELSVVCPASLAPQEIAADRDWCLLRVNTPEPLNQAGILVAVLDPLAEYSIPVFVHSTFDTNYVFLKATSLPAAVDALRQAGHQIGEE